MSAGPTEGVRSSPPVGDGRPAVSCLKPRVDGLDWHRWMASEFPARVSVLRTGAALVRLSLTVRVRPQGRRYSNRFTRPLAVARRLFLPGIDARGLAVSIAVTTPARHAGSHVVRMRGWATAPRCQRSAIGPGHLAGLCCERFIRSQKES